MVQKAGEELVVELPAKSVVDAGVEIKAKSLNHDANLS